jgi:hypothetical protein
MLHLNKACWVELPMFLFVDNKLVFLRFSKLKSIIHHDLLYWMNEMLIVQFNSYYFKCYLTLLLCQYSGHDYYEMEALHELSPIDKF